MKIIALIMALLSLVACFLFGGCGGGKEPDEPHIVGGYTEDRAVTDEDMAVFDQAMDGLVGVIYEPTLVATQVVAGLNYRFTATATGVYPGAEPYQVHIVIYKPLGGAPAELTEIIVL